MPRVGNAKHPSSSIRADSVGPPHFPLCSGVAKGYGGSCSSSDAGRRTFGATRCVLPKPLGKMVCALPERGWSATVPEEVTLSTIPANGCATLVDRCAEANRRSGALAPSRGAQLTAANANQHLWPGSGDASAAGGTWSSQPWRPFI